MAMGEPGERKIEESLTPCPLCEGADKVSPYLSYEGLRWVLCGGCQMGWQVPYLSEIHREEDGEIQSAYSRYHGAIEAVAAVAAEKARWVAASCSRDEVVYEVGPGTGALADALSKLVPGIRYVGIEANEEFARQLRSRGYTVVCGPADTALVEAFAREGKDGARAVIVMDNVLEHIPHPVQAVRSMVGLAPRGSRLLVEVPNEAGLGWRTRLQDFLRGKPQAPTFPGHINLFTRPTLKRTLEKATGSRTSVWFKPIRTPEEICYLMRAERAPVKARAVLAALRIVPIDRILGVPYWLRAEVDFQAK